MNDGTEDAKLERILEFLRDTRGFDFTGYKRSSLLRRVSKRAHMVSMHDLADYLDYLQVQPDEFTQLFDTILINVTGFFRDPPAWDYLRKDVLPRLISLTADAAPIRVWSAGCSSGEETFSLAMCLAEALGPDAFRDRVKIYATDIDEEALQQARQASYPATALETVPPELRERYFERAGTRFNIRHDLRHATVFGRLNLMVDAPISKIDLLACRNALMYFNFEAQSGILARLHFALKETGILFLGRAEMMLTRPNLFIPVDLKHRIFVKAPGTPWQGAAPAGRQHEGNEMRTRLQERAVDGVPFAQVVVDVNAMIVLVNEQAASVGLGPKSIGHPLGEAEICYRPVELRPLIDKALLERRRTSVTNVTRSLPDGQQQHLDIEVTPLFDEAGRALGASIIFPDVTRYYHLQAEIERSGAALETAYEELRSTNEELQTTNEELQSTVEELETTNEELQSSNEEMETMNEELESTNEELRATNEQLRRRSGEVDQLNSFLESILGSMQSGVVVLDPNLAVRSWNRKAEDLWGLRAEEVQGQPFFNLDIGLPLEQLRQSIRGCLAANGRGQRIVVEARNRRGKAIRCAVTCAALHTTGGRTEGVLLLMEQTE